MRDGTSDDDKPPRLHELFTLWCYQRSRATPSLSSSSRVPLAEFCFLPLSPRTPRCVLSRFETPPPRIVYSQATRVTERERERERERANELTASTELENPECEFIGVSKRSLDGKRDVETYIAGGCSLPSFLTSVPLPLV